MSQISKCPDVTVVLTYWEASGDVSELRYKSLLYCSSKRSYCSGILIYFRALVKFVEIYDSLLLIGLPHLATVVGPTKVMKYGTIFTIVNNSDNFVTICLQLFLHYNVDSFCDSVHQI